MYQALEYKQQNCVWSLASRNVCFVLDLELSAPDRSHVKSPQYKAVNVYGRFEGGMK